MKMSPLIPCATLTAFASFLAGCAGPVAKTGEVAPPQRIVTTEYKQVYVTGSHIPVLVPTSPTARTPPPISPLVILTADDMRRQGGPLR